MLDLKLIRKDPESVEKKLKTKGSDFSLRSFLELDEQIRKLQSEVEDLKSKRNAASKEIGLQKQEGKTFSNRDQLTQWSNQITSLDQKLSELEKQREEALCVLPNLPMDEIPVSLDPKDNVCIKEFGKKVNFSFSFKNHVELNEKLHLFDFKRGAKISGAGWPIYTDLGARLEWALINYMLDIHRKNGFTQFLPPLLVKKEIMFGSGQLPKFENQLFKLKDDEYFLYLIPTAEIALNGYHYDEILEEKMLPLKYMAYTPCFRREAGAAGKQERGLIRMHQFNKVELFCFSTPEESPKVFEEMMASAEEVLQGLELHYRNMLLVTGDMSYASAKTIDIEVWLPGQNRYYEVSSVSNCTDFQARRSMIRFKGKGDKKPELVHTLNGSGVATSRLMVALLENNQREDGSISIPKVLQKYLGENLSVIRPRE